MAAAGGGDRGVAPAASLCAFLSVTGTAAAAAAAIAAPTAPAESEAPPLLMSSAGSSPAGGTAATSVAAVAAAGAAGAVTAASADSAAAALNVVLAASGGGRVFGGALRSAAAVATSRELGPLLFEGRRCPASIISCCGSPVVCCRCPDELANVVTAASGSSACRSAGLWRGESRIASSAGSEWMWRACGVKGKDAGEENNANSKQSRVG